MTVNGVNGSGLRHNEGTFLFTVSLSNLELRDCCMGQEGAVESGFGDAWLGAQVHWSHLGFLSCSTEPTPGAKAFQT